MIDIDIVQQLGAFRLDVRFSAEAPIVGLFGPSGSGKTSVINAIAGISTPADGHIRINGTDLYDSKASVNVAIEQRRVGYVFQDPLLFPHLSVEANLLYGHHRRQRTERFVEPPRVIELLGLGSLLQRKPRLLSGGEKQRVAIGRALLAQPRILLMDEPLAALDVARKAEILDYVERLRDEFHIPIVYVSHSAAEIARLADAVVVIEQGKCAAVGDAESILGRLELKQQIDRYEAASLLDAVVTAHDSRDQLTTLTFDGGELLVPTLDAALGERVRARVRARDVSIALTRPADISVLNILPGRVAAVAEASGAVVDIHIEVGGTNLIARITRRSAQHLGIRAGLEIYALIKAVSLGQQNVGHA
jgi:molybdate transport system ATP-binding protein